MTTAALEPAAPVLTGTVVSLVPAADDGPTLTELCGSWQIALMARIPPLAANSRALYASGVRAFVTWHERAHPGVPVTVAALTRRNVTRWLADIQAAGASPGTARARYAAVRQFSKWLAREGETPGAADSDDGRTPDPLAGMEAPRGGQRRVDALSPSELAALIKACKAPAGADARVKFEAIRDLAAVQLFAETGLRAGELAALQRADVDLRDRRVTVRRAKGNKTRVVAFGKDAALALDRTSGPAGPTRPR